MSRSSLLLLAASLGLPASVQSAFEPSFQAPGTCGGVKEMYRAYECCGNPSKTVTVAKQCPYDFSQPLCSVSEPQAPRDLSTTQDGLAQGMMTPKAATLSDAQAEAMPLANVHFHLGAEHKSDDYNDATASDAWDQANAGGRRLAGDVRPGWMCQGDLTAEEQTPYTFQYCKGDVTVGKSYEVHYVHSSAGYTAEDLEGSADIDLMNDGLGGAANGRGQRNPFVVVQAQVYQIVNDANAPQVDDLLHGWTVVGHNNAVMYPGSTTGPSNNNQYCSPFAVTWHVDTQCHKVSAQSFDNLCKQMKDLYKLEGDLYPHGSRVLVDPQWVVSKDYVLPLA